MLHGETFLWAIMGYNGYGVGLEMNLVQYLAWTGA
jgi:hypothetical protein